MHASTAQPAVGTPGAVPQCRQPPTEAIRRDPMLISLPPWNRATVANRRLMFTRRQYRKVSEQSQGSFPGTDQVRANERSPVFWAVHGFSSVLHTQLYTPAAY